MMDRLIAAEVFVDVAYTGSFTMTAERLGMSRPKVTRYIEQMESWLDTRLLHRTTRKVRLTNSGERCLPEIERWLDDAHRIVNEVKSTDQLNDAIRISASASFGSVRVMPAVIEFMRRHPKVSIDVELSDTATDLIEERIDLALRIASNPSPSLIGKPIARCKSILVASKAYIDSHEPLQVPTDLESHDCMGYKNFGRHIWYLRRQHQQVAVKVNCRLSINETSALLNAAMAGGGITMQPTYLTHDPIKNHQLIRVLPEWEPNELTIYALYSSRKYLSPTVRALIDFLAEYFKAHPWD